MQDSYPRGGKFESHKEHFNLFFPCKKVCMKTLGKSENIFLQEQIVYMYIISTRGHTAVASESRMSYHQSLWQLAQKQNVLTSQATAE